MNLDMEKIKQKPLSGVCCKEEIIAFSIDSKSLSLNRLVETLMKDIKHVVGEKQEFEKRDESVLLAFVFGLSGLPWNEFENQNFNEKHSYKF